MSDKYKIIIWWSEEDHCYLAEMPELFGCIADGQTREAALSMLETVAEEWIEAAIRYGNPIPQPQRENVAA